jgi:hypothetical protein
LTVRLPRVPRKQSLPFTLVQTEPNPAAERAARERRATRFAQQAGRGFATLTVLPVIIVVAWLVPGLLLLFGGVFEPVPELLIAAPLATALAVNLMHRIPDRWPSDLPGSDPRRGWPAALGILGTAATAAGFIAWQIALNSPSVIAARAPGVYFQTGYWIAQHGSLPIPGSLSAFGGPRAGLHLASVGFAEHGHNLLPKVTAGLPMLLTAGFWTSGTGGGAVIGPVLGGLAIVTFGGLVGRLAGRQWAPAGALVLALTLPELYTSRDAFGETAVQVLLFGGISLVIDALAASGTGASAAGPTAAGRPNAGREQVGVGATAARSAGAGPRSPAWLSNAWPGETEQPAPPKPAETAPLTAFGSMADGTANAGWPGSGSADLDRTAPLPAVVATPVPARRPALWSRMFSGLRGQRWRDLPFLAGSAITAETMLGGLGGLALGLTSLLSLASLAYLVPAILVAGVLLSARRAVGLAFSIGLVVGCGYGLAAAYLLAQPPAWPQMVPLKVIGLDAGGLALLTVAAVQLLRFHWARRLTRDIVARPPIRWLPGFASAVVIGGIAWLAVRPYMQKVRGDLGPAAAHYVAHLQRIAGLPVDPHRLYSEDTLYWVIWYAGIATMLLGAFGAAILIRRSLRALLSWQDTSGMRLNWALPIAVFLVGSAAVLWQPFTVPDQPWASRRLVPVVLPGLILLATWAAAWLTRRARDRGAGVTTAGLVGAFCVGAMLLPSVSTSFGFGLTHAGARGGLQPTAGGLAQHRVGQHEADAIRSLCASIGGSSSVLIIDRQIARDFSQVIRGMCAVPVAWVSPSAPAPTISAAIAGIARSGRHAVALGSSPPQVGVFGGSPTLVMKLVTTQYPHELTQPPGAPWHATYRIWMTSIGVPNWGV